MNVRPRAALLGCLLGLLICAFTPYNNNYLNATPLAGGHFPLAPFFILFWLVIVCGVARRLSPGLVLLSGPEALVVWVLMVVVSGLGYTGLVRTFFVVLTAPDYLATAGNRWSQTLVPNLPAGLFVTDRAALEGLYEGLSGGPALGWTEVFLRIPWRAWSGPLLSWSVFVLLSYLVMLCVVNLFSRQWIENERMNFPLLQAPRELTGALEEGGVGALLSDRFLLAGILLAVLLHAVNGLNFYVPSVPQIPTQILAGKYFAKTGILSGFQKLKIYILPAYIGFAFLTSRQISLSLWLFFLLGCLSSGVLAALGYELPVSVLGATFGPTLSRPEEMQMIGAVVVFGLFILWLARFHLASSLRAAVSPVPPREPEWIGPRMTLLGLLLGLAGLAAWLAVHGLEAWLTLLILAAFLLVSLVATRVICQGGIAYFTLTVAPLDAVIGAFGAKILGGVGLVLSAVTQKALFADLRESLMPSLAHAFKAGEGVRNKRLLLGAVALAVAAGVAVSGAAMLALCYKYGVRELHMEWSVSTTTGMFETVQRLLEGPGESRRWIMAFASLGAAVMLGLIVLYQLFYWWPIHPIGYLMTYSSAMQIIWFSFLVGWLANHLTLRYGGVVLFRRVRLFFIGLIIGDFLMGGVFALYGFHAGSSYQVLPG